ncbi:MAG: nitroreductase family deazaflavin-dependent oxidoreductase [Pseudomonadales bacterium]|nr:nitroreductase family deazaflavin-dependent oxidoreductase [Pseudomonadales bacterium]
MYKCHQPLIHRPMMHRPLIIAALLLLNACTDYLPFSSAALQGTVTENPQDWSEVATTEIIQLETGGAQPYSVNLWVAEIQGDLVVFAGDNQTTWVENINKNPQVRLQAKERIYELTATQITDAETFAEFAQVWEAKYGKRPRNEKVDETYLYRLRAR